MSDFKKWFSARARNPDKITLEEAFEAGAHSQRVLIMPARITPGKAPECFQLLEGQTMAKEDIMRMAREAGFDQSNSFEELIVRHSNGSWVGISDRLERFAELVAATERDACAAICNGLESFWSAEKDVALLNGDVALSNATSGEPRAARALAAAIRARGEK